MKYIGYRKYSLRAALAVLGLGILVSGCMQSTIEPASEANFTPRDKKLLAAAPYERVTIPEPYKRHIVDYHRSEAADTILIDTDARYLYYVLPHRKAIRYGVTVGEEALAFSGVAKIGRMTEWPVLDADPRDQAAHARAEFCRPGPAESDGGARLIPLRG